MTKTDLINEYYQKDRVNEESIQLMIQEKKKYSKDSKEYNMCIKESIRLNTRKVCYGQMIKDLEIMYN